MDGRGGRGMWGGCGSGSGSRGRSRRWGRGVSRWGVVGVGGVQGDYGDRS